METAAIISSSSRQPCMSVTIVATGHALASKITQDFEPSGMKHSQTLLFKQASVECEV
jgi:hypothetical protein